MSVSDRHASKTAVARAAAGVCALGMLLAVTNNAQASESAAQLVSSFQTLCLAEPLDFARSDKKATELQLSVQQSMGARPDESGYFAHSKSWTVMTAVPHELIVTETHGPKGDFKSCGIRATEIDAADFKVELINALKLGKAASETVSADGMFRHAVWAIGDRTLTLSDKTPQNMKQGVRLLISNKPL
jgi:hypothetical protein